MSGSASTAGTAPPPEAEIVWLPFAGTAERMNRAFRLTARSGNGFIELGENDVGFDWAHNVYVRKGAVLTHVDEPWHTDPRGRSAGDADAEITACVGTVLIRCSDFQVLGTAQGSWGCSRPAFVP